MQFTGETMKRGTSQAGEILIEYDIIFDNFSLPLRFSAKFHKDEGRTVVGSANYNVVKKQVITVFIDSDLLSPDERLAVYTDMENTIKKLWHS